MSLQKLFFLSTILFILGIAGLFVAKDIVSVFVTYQLIMVATIINFLSFSIHGGLTGIWDKIFLIVGSITLYLLIFSVFFYKYFTNVIVDRNKIIADHRLFILKKSDWWGEDNI